VVSDARRDDVAFAAFRPLIKGASTVIRVYRPAEEPSLARYITHRPVSANYFSLMRIPLVEGRAPIAGTEGREVVASEMLARTLWPGESAVGKTLKKLKAKDSVDITVVGVARDVPIRAVGQFEPVVYSNSASLPLAVVSTATPEAMEYLRRASRALESSAFLVATPLRQTVRESASDIETASVVGWLVGAAALLISTLGIFGVFSYAVEERRREIGIRIALGGRATHVRLEVLRSGQQAAALGTGIGFALCVIVASLLRHQLYGLQPLHAFTYIQVAAILGAAVLMALWIPAWRATRVDPAVTLRCD
jgi:ABC-type antimicrobial peptide transport system permease subunit